MMDENSVEYRNQQFSKFQYYNIDIGTSALGKGLVKGNSAELKLQLYNNLNI